MKIGIFGGTFDPVHFGHLELARSALVQFSLDKVIFVPACQPPHKTELKYLTSPKDRYEMVRLAIAGEPAFGISDCELNRKGVSYTVDTLRYFEKQFPGAELFLILGQDAFEMIDTWHQPLEIRKRVKFLVAKRGLLPAMTLEIPDVSWVRMPLCSISASGIREAIKQGKKTDDYLPQEVLRYIQVRNLYHGKT
ncbi:MAG TPA: nicotinate-nucleotide adenylyltransferase [Candidatus Omnitrophota bacterium]|nr:nicotinate-nucleotide adenylyltransferase [Candidatus Omnitrophota bacterium]HPS36460.1 nicotinate-nucleotide adenylyltransferase [Candidatus Omnitrophota bacterium]